MNRYAVALGSNRAYGTARTPRMVIERALVALMVAGLTIEARAPVIETPPIGPSRRRFANSAVLVQTPLSPPELLAMLKRIEAGLGRRRGQRWAARSIDLDIILWSGGRWCSRTLTVPHPHWRSRNFVLRPLAAIAGDWRDPLTGLTPRQLAGRLRR